MGYIFLYKSSIAYRFHHVLTSFYGFWNLDFFRYILPPFCISPNLKLIHITFLYYISAFYPLCLICITWICIELHFRHFKPIVWLWSKVTRCLSKRLTVKLDYSNSLISVFATFFLLSYAKIVFTIGRSIRFTLIPKNAVIMNNHSLYTHQLSGDPSIAYFSRKHLPLVIILIFTVLFAILPPTLLLTLYPVKVLRSLLFKSHLSTRTIAALNMFVEKYYSCYRDGTDGGKDMRSLVSMYFLLRLLISILYIGTFFSIKHTFDATAVLYAGCGLMIALVRPYKRAYMNIIDALILGIMALIAVTLDNYVVQESSDILNLICALIICTFSFIPLLSLVGFITYKLLKCPLMMNFSTRLPCLSNISSRSEPVVANESARQENSSSSSDTELLDVPCPKQYDGEHTNHVSTDYIQHEDTPNQKFVLYVSQ